FAVPRAQHPKTGSAVAGSDRVEPRRISAKEQTPGTSHLTLDNQIPALDLHGPRTHRLLSRSADDGTGSHVELAAVAGARYRGAIQLAFRQGAPSVRTRVIEGIKSSPSICNVHLRSTEIENMHRPGDDILRTTNSHGHPSPPLQIGVNAVLDDVRQRSKAAVVLEAVLVNLLHVLHQHNGY